MLRLCTHSLQGSREEEGVEKGGKGRGGERKKGKEEEESKGRVEKRESEGENI